MGYYKNMEIELQENLETDSQQKIDRITRWHNEHRHTVPSYIFNRIVSDVDLLGEMIDAWTEIPEPLPASRHVALQSRPRHRKPKTDWSLNSGETKMFMTLYISTMLFVLFAVIGLAVL